MCRARGGTEGSENDSQFHSAHWRITQLFGLFVRGRGGWKWRVGKEEERRELGRGKTRERKMRVGLQVREKDSEELMSHSAKEAHN